MQNLVRLELVGMLLFAPVAFAELLPTPGSGDPQIQQVSYDPNRVVSLNLVLGYQMMLEFSVGEHIENISIGDASSWQITPNKRADKIFIKALSDGAVTNMTVITESRRYVFNLTAHIGTADQAAYVIHFLYPNSDQEYQADGANIKNSDYKMHGEKSLRPDKVFDDGYFTYFLWKQEASLPAIFATDFNGSEHVVNVIARNGFLVVEQLAPSFILRSGKKTAEIINHAFNTTSAASTPVNKVKP